MRLGASWLGDGFCNIFEYNTEECAFDEGGCIEANEKFSLLYSDFRAQFPNCSVEDPVLLFDGYCQSYWIAVFNIPATSNEYNVLTAYNTPECGYDNGANVTW